MFRSIMTPILTLTLTMMVALLATVAVAWAQPSIGKPFELKVGQSETVGSHGLVVGFAELQSDGRCPIGLYCFWQGDATAQLWANLPTEPRQDFQLHTFRDFKWRTTYGDYEIYLLNISPYPVDQVPTPPGDYIATVLVEGGPAPVSDTTWGRIKALYH